MIELPRPYPLTWPTGRERSSFRRTSRFDTSCSNGKSLAAVCDELDAELRRLGVTNFVLSTNIQTNTRGRPDSRISAGSLDPGAALYFEHEKRQICLACDKWDKVACNVMAIVKHIEALRGQQRWGVSDLKRDFSGYAALPERSVGRLWYDVMGIPSECTMDAIKARFRLLSKTLHPDAGGGGEGWHELNEAYQQAIASKTP